MTVANVTAFRAVLNLTVAQGSVLSTVGQRGELNRAEGYHPSVALNRFIEAGRLFPWLNCHPARTGQKGCKQENECFLHAANYQRLIFSDSKLFLLAFPRKAPKESVKA